MAGKVKDDRAAKFLLLGKDCSKCIKCEFISVDKDTSREWHKYEFYEDELTLQCSLMGKHTDRICFKYREKY